MANQKNVLFISYDGMTDPLGQSQVIPYLQGLSRHGYKIFLLSCEKSQVFLQHKATVEALLQPFNISWVPIGYTKNPPVLSTIADIIKLRVAAKKIHQQHHMDLVHTRPGVPALIGLWLKKKFGIKFLNDIREFYADSRVDGLMWNLKNPLFKSVYKYFKRKEAEAVAINDGIVCLTYAAEKIIQSWPGYNKAIPLQVIPCSADLTLFDTEKIDAAQAAAVKKELGITENNFIVSYLGSIGGWYLTDEMLQFCKVLNDKMPQVKFLFISPHRHNEILAAAAKYNIAAENIIIKKASRQQVPLFLSLSHCSVFFIRPCYSKQSSSPTKHGEIMAMGIPLITNSGVGDVQAIVEQYHSGIIVHEFNEAAYAKAADQIIQSMPFNTAEIKKGAKEFYDLDSAIEKYIRIYDSMLRH